MGKITRKVNGKEYVYDIDYAKEYKTKRQKRRQIIVEVDNDIFEQFTNKIESENKSKNAFLKEKILEYLGS